jgi:hypothetical protein
LLSVSIGRNKELRTCVGSGFASSASDGPCPFSSGKDMETSAFEFPDRLGSMRFARFDRSIPGDINAQSD